MQKKVLIGTGFCPKKLSRVEPPWLKTVSIGAGLCLEKLSRLEPVFAKRYRLEPVFAPETVSTGTALAQKLSTRLPTYLPTWFSLPSRQNVSRLGPVPKWLVITSFLFTCLCCPAYSSRTLTHPQPARELRKAFIWTQHNRSLSTEKPRKERGQCAIQKTPFGLNAQDPSPPEDIYKSVSCNWRPRLTPL